MLDVLKAFLSYVRTDIHAVRRKTKDGAWIYKDVRRPATDDDLQRHLDPKGPHLGAYIMKPGEDTTSVALYDLDDHHGKAGYDTVLASAHAIVRTALKYRLEPWIVKSGSGQGIHIFFRWAEPQKAKAVRSVLNRVLLLSGFHQGASQHGVAKGEVDIFPKQERLEPEKPGGDNQGSMGSLVALPFGRESRPLNIKLEEVAQPEPWLDSSPCREIREEKKEEHQNKADPAVVREALSHVPAEDWTQWVRMGIALKNAYDSDEGFDIWNEWSSTAGNYAGERGCRMEWNRFRPNGAITLGSLFHLAQENGWQGSPGGPQTTMFSDQWCADQFAQVHGARFRHVTQSHDWRVFEGNLWRQMDRLEMFSEVKREAAQWAEKSTKGKKDLTSSKKHASIVYMVKLAQDEHGNRIATSKDDWDTDPWLMGTPLGILDLRTGEVKPDRMKLVSMSAQAAPAGECPRWTQFMKEVTKDDEELVLFLQRLAGYCLTGDTSEEKMFILYGPGGNGKSAFIETLAWVLGDYGATLSANALLATKGMADRHPTELAKLYRKRLAIASETSEGARFNTALIKNLTGGDRIVARFMRQDEFEFDPTHKTVLSSNQLPLLGNVDRAVERRVVLVKLDQTVDKPDTRLKQKLRREAGGVMAWAMAGLRAWENGGLQVPDKVVQATKEYLKEQDDLSLFLADCVGLGPNYEELSSNLYNAWAEWGDRNGAYVGSHRAFAQRLQAKGFRTRHGRNGTLLIGLRLGGLGPQDAAAYKDDLL